MVNKCGNPKNRLKNTNREKRTQFHAVFLQTDPRSPVEVGGTSADPRRVPRNTCMSPYYRTVHISDHAVPLFHDTIVRINGNLIYCITVLSIAFCSGLYLFVNVRMSCRVLCDLCLGLHRRLLVPLSTSSLLFILSCRSV